MRIKNYTLKLNRSIFIKILFLIFNFTFLITKGQFYNLPGDYFYALLTERGLAEPDSSIHSSVKPYIHFYSPKYIHVADSYKVFKYIKDDLLLDKIFNDNLINVKNKENKYRFSINPFLNLEIGRDFSDTLSRNLYNNGRGFIANGYIGKKFYFETMVAETQSLFPNYIETENKNSLVVPGQGRWKVFKTRGFDYAFSSGFISCQITKNINIQAGHGKQKIGNGYRSLFLSDNAFNYPYVRVTQQWFKGRVQYTNIYASLMNLDSASAKSPPYTELLFQKKAASFQYLSINFTKRINIGFFQGLIWQAADRNNVPHFDWQYFNPVIFTNLAFYGLNNKNNILIGSDFNFKLSKTISLYGQIMADDLSTRNGGWGYQLGARYFNAFKIKKLFLQGEYNSVSETAYTNPSTSNLADQSFSHYNQNLAYTPNNGKELILISDYKFKRLFFSAKYNYQSFTLNNNNFYTNNIFNFKVGYTINTAYNANVSLGYSYRTQDFFGTTLGNNNTSYVYASFKINLYNAYFDF